MNTSRILFISGIADDRKAGFVRFSESGVQEYDLYGSCNLFSHVQGDGVEAFLSILTPDNTQTLNIGGLNGVFNQISDADTHLQALVKADSLFSQIPDTIQKFNRPSAVLKTTREQISERLQGIDGLHVPKTIRIHPRSPDEIVDAIREGPFGFPVLFFTFEHRSRKIEIGFKRMLADKHGGDSVFGRFGDEEMETLRKLGNEGFDLIMGGSTDFDPLGDGCRNVTLIIVQFESLDIPPFGLRFERFGVKIALIARIGGESIDDFAKNFIGCIGKIEIAALAVFENNLLFYPDVYHIISLSTEVILIRPGRIDC